MDRNQPITYICMSFEEWQKALADAAQPDDMLSESTVLKRFDMGKDWLLSLVDEGKVTRWVIPGKAKSFRYSYKQIRNNWKPL